MGAIDATDDAVSFSIGQLDALATNDIGLTAGDAVTLSDTASNIEALTPTLLSGYATQGVDTVSAQGGTLEVDEAQVAAVVATSMVFASGNGVTLSDTGANIALLDSAAVGKLGGHGVDAIDASDDQLSLSIAQYQALGTVTLTAGDTVTLSDTAAHLAALDATAIAALANVDVLSATDTSMSLDASQVAAILAKSGLTIATGNTVTLSDTGAHIAELTAEQIGALAGKGIDSVDASDDTLALSVAQYQALGTVTLAGGDLVTLLDTAAHIAALDAAHLTGLSNVDVLDASDALSLDASQVVAILAHAGLTIEAADTVTLADTGASIAGLTSVQFGQLAAKGIDAIDASDNVLSLTVAQYEALGAVTLAGGDVVTLADSGASLAGLTAIEIGALASGGIDALDATDDELSLTVAQYKALGTVTLAAGDTVTLADTGADLAGLTSIEIGALAAAGVDKLDADDNALSLSVAQYQALGTVTLASADTVTLADTGASLAGLTALQLGDLATSFVDKIDATDDVLSLTVAKYDALLNVSLASGDLVTLADTGANLAALSAIEIGALAGRNVDQIDASDDTLALTVAKYEALGTVALAAGDTVTLADTGANLAGLTALEIGALAGKNIDALDATDDALSLTVAKYAALGTVTLAAGDTVTLADTGADLAGLTALEIAALAGKNVDKLDATDNVLSLNVAQYQALGSATLAAGDVVTLADTGSNLATLTPEQIAALAAAGIDKLNASNDALSLTVAQYEALGTVTLAAGDIVTLADTGAEIGGLTALEIGALADAGIDELDATDDTLALSIAQYKALGTVTLASTDTATLADTGSGLAALTELELAALAGKGIDALDADDDVLSLTVAQYQALGTVTLTAGDVVTLADTGAHLAGLTASEIGDLGGDGIDKLDASDDTLALTVAKFQALGAVTLAAGDTVTLADTGDHIDDLSADAIAALAGKGIDKIDASDDTLSLSVAQYGALGTVTLATADTVTLADTGASLADLSALAIGALAAGGIDRLDASDNALSLTVAQYNALATVTLTAGDTVTLFDTAAHLAALDASAISALSNVDVLDASDTNMSLDASQVAAILAKTGLAIAAGDVVTLADTGSNIAALTSGQFGSLAGKGVDKIDASDNTLALTVAQYLNLGAVTLAGADVVTLADSGVNLGTLTAVQIGALAGKGIDKLDADDNALSLTLAQYQALGAVTLAAGDAVALTDTGAQLAALTTGQLAVLTAGGVDRLDASDDLLSLSVAQYQSLNGVGLTAGDTVTLVDTSTHLAVLTTLQLGALAAAGIDVLDASNNALALSLAQYQALGGVTINTGDKLTITGTSGAETITGGNEADRILGAAGNDTLLGGNGNDTLEGSSGKDSLTGGAGADHFVFNTTLATSNIDRVTDFAHGTDKIDLENAVFKMLTHTGALASSAFHVVSSGHAASTTSQYIIYNKTDGTLWYDSDGKGSHAAVEFAVLTTHPGNLSASDFLII